MFVGEERLRGIARARPVGRYGIDVKIAMGKDTYLVEFHLFRRHILYNCECGSI